MTPELIEDMHRRFARVLVLSTVRDAADIAEYRKTGAWRRRYYYQFGFEPKTKDPNPEKRYKRISKEIEAWISGEEFSNLCTKLGYNIEHYQTLIRQLLAGEARDQIADLLDELEKDLHHYARRGPQPGFRQKEDAGHIAPSGLIRGAGDSGFDTGGQSLNRSS